MTHYTYIFGDSRLPERFWRKIQVNRLTGCWEWCAFVNPSGYGMFNIGRRVARLTHRVAYTALAGKIEDGFQLDHLCRNTKCCNPDHLEPVNPRENCLRSNAPAAKNKRKAACPQCGSGYVVRSDGHRYCKPCKNQKQAARLKQRYASDAGFRTKMQKRLRREHRKLLRNPGAAEEPAGS